MTKAVVVRGWHVGTPGKGRQVPPFHRGLEYCSRDMRGSGGGDLSSLPMEHKGKAIARFAFIFSFVERMSWERH